MNNHIFFLVLCICSVFLPSTYGRQIHTGDSFYDQKPSSHHGDTKYKLKQLVDAYSQDKNGYPTQKHLFKLNVDSPKKMPQNYDTNENIYPDLGSESKKKRLSMEVGKHLVKITSALQSKSLKVKQPEKGGHEISVNPKFSHVIEILPLEEHDHEKDHEFENEGEFEKLEEHDHEKDHEFENEGEFEKFEEPVFKITSALQSQEVKVKQSEKGGHEISVNPKFSHAIEVLPFKDHDHEEDHEFKNAEEAVKFKQLNFDTEENEISIHEKIDPKTIDEVNENHTEDENDIEEEEETFTEGIDKETEDEIEYEDENENDTQKLKTNMVTDEMIVDDTEIDTEESKTDTEEVKPENASDTEEKINSDRLNEVFQTNSPSKEEEVNELSGSDNQESAFNEISEGSGEEFASEDSEDESKSGRLLGFFSSRNATSPNCTTPKGESGQCRPISQCILSDALSNFNLFLEHLCLIRGAMVGVCCPNNPVIEISNPDDNSTNSTSEVDIKQPPEGCGLNTKTRIVGGSISVPHEWTWMVALLRNGRFFCGGVIINNWYILTAAHCVLGTNVKDLAVRLGEYDFNTQNKHKEDIPISEIKRHAQFVTLTFQHDIALLKLRRGIQYSKFVGSICLPNQKARDYSDVTGTVVGWGTVSFGGSASPILRQVTIPIWKNEDCDKAYLLENISESFMCAGSPEKGEDACQGDSGGPLMTVNDRGRWEVIGLVSWGRRCGDPTYPGVYTRVTTYMDWINENAV